MTERPAELKELVVDNVGKHRPLDEEQVIGFIRRRGEYEALEAEFVGRRGEIPIQPALLDHRKHAPVTRYTQVRKP